jgi:hypothetical protein
MARQREETYFVVEPDSTPHCVVEGCGASVVAEVHHGDYAIALELFRGVRREKVRSRRQGDEPFFVCPEHLERDPRMAALRWQWLMF